MFLSFYSAQSSSQYLHEFLYTYFSFYFFRGYYVVPVEKSTIIVFNSDEVGNFSMSDESGLPFYITANLTLDEANKTFVIGDKKVYNGFYNAPLSEKREYEVLVGVVSSLNGVSNFILNIIFCLAKLF